MLCPTACNWNIRRGYSNGVEHLFQQYFSFGNWIYKYLLYLYILPLSLWIRIPLVTMSTRYNIISSTNKTDRHDITEILLKEVFNTITVTPSNISIASCRTQHYLTMFRTDQYSDVLLTVHANIYLTPPYMVDLSCSIIQKALPWWVTRIPRSLDV
jgi:hypothetical protein